MTLKVEQIMVTPYSEFLYWKDHGRTSLSTETLQSLQRQQRAPDVWDEVEKIQWILAHSVSTLTLYERG